MLTFSFEEAEMNTIVAFLGTIASLFCAAFVGYIFQLPTWLCIVLWPVFAILLCLLLDKHHWYD